MPRHTSLELGGLSGADEGQRGGSASGDHCGDSVKVAGADLALVLGCGVAARLRAELQLQGEQARTGSISTASLYWRKEA